MSRHLTRRDFLVTTGAVALGSRLSARQSAAKLRHAVIGCAGQGGSDLGSIAKHPAVDIVALCDVDANNLARAAKRFPNAKQYRDYRVMFKEMGAGIDTVNIGIPDHMHAAPAVIAMNLGKHVYVQKPLTHDVFESRRLAEIAREKKVQSQMGIQVHSSAAYRTGVRLIRDGAIGRVKEVHSWSNKKWGFDGPRPAGADPIPPNLEWDLWLGTAPERPYKAEIYHPGDWRRWTDFGCGTMGDMSIHILDPVAGALGLTAPTTIISDSDPPPAESFATRNKVRYTFPGTAQTVDPFPLTWYDGDAVPSTEGWPIDALPSQGSMFVGEKGFMLLPHTAMPRLYPEETFKTFEMPKVEGLNHWHTWLDACLGEGTPSANFDYSGPLTEFVLLGVVANRVPGVTLTWHAKDMRLDGSDKAAALLRRTYRTGWEVSGL
jgi:predicted dehydrogenase